MLWRKGAVGLASRCLSKQRLRHMDIQDVYSFIEQNQGVKLSRLKPASDLCFDLGIDGDDFSELMTAFSERYSVNLDSYRWCFHHGEEGWNIGALFFPAPYQQVRHIPVTPQVLLDAAEARCWLLVYPEHSISSRAAESAVNCGVLLGLLGLVAVCALFSLG